MDLKIGTDGDLAFENGDLVLVTGVDAIAQLVGQRLKFFQGEWFLDTLKGIPFFDDIFVKTPNPTLVDAIFKKVILDTPGMLRLDQFALTLDRARRTLSLTFKGISTSGPVDFNATNLDVGGAF